MCTVSMVITDFEKRWPQIQSVPNQMPYSPGIAPGVIYSPPTRAEFEALRAEVTALRGLLEAAKKFDEETGQKDCEQEEKVALLKRIAEMVGVDISDVLASGE